MPGIKNLLGPRTLLALAVAYTLFITVALLAPVKGDPAFQFPFLDKLVHIAIHAALVFLWLWYFSLDDKCHFNFRLVALALVICFFYGIIIEALQYWFTTTRTFDFFDILANGTGDLLGLLSFRIAMKK